MLLVVGAFTLGMVAAAAAQPEDAVLYGDTFLLSGSVQDGAGHLVIVVARPHGRSAFSEVGRTRTTSSGRWRYNARPTIRTIYRARIGRLLSQPVVVDVEPRIVLSGDRGEFTARVRAARSLQGRYVVLQRRTSGAWQHVRRLVLDGESSTGFTFGDPAPRIQIRLLMPRSQVGPGYVDARSPVFTLIRR